MKISDETFIIMTFPPWNPRIFLYLHGLKTEISHGVEPDRDIPRPSHRLWSQVQAASVAWQDLTIFCSKGWNFGQPKRDSMRSQNHKIRCGEDVSYVFWTVQRRAFKAFVAPFFTWDQWHGPGQQNDDKGLIRALLGSNTSICLRHSLDTVNSGSFWHSSKTQAGDLCVIAWIILNQTLNPKPETLKTIENQETTLNLNFKAQIC